MTEATLRRAVGATKVEWEAWSQEQGEDSLSVQLQELEGETATLELARDGKVYAALALTAMDASSFFLEALGEASDEVEEWVTNLNSTFADRAFTFSDALSAIRAKIPAKKQLEDEEAPADRAAKRKAQEEDAHWAALAEASASQGSRQASQVLMREMRSLMALPGSDGKKALEVDMVKDSLYHWSVKMKFGASHPSKAAAVVMEVLFPDSFPMAPPFIRLVRPRFQMHTGHITVGGSVCMQLLTPSGWLPTVSLENVFVAIRSEMVEGGGRLDFSCTRDYSAQEAREAFQRVAQRPDLSTTLALLLLMLSRSFLR
eukprot:s3326_g5.t1